LEATFLPGSVGATLSTIQGRNLIAPLKKNCLSDWLLHLLMTKAFKPWSSFAVVLLSNCTLIWCTHELYFVWDKLVYRFSSALCVTSKLLRIVIIPELLVSAVVGIIVVYWELYYLVLMPPSCIWLFVGNPFDWLCYLWAGRSIWLEFFPLMLMNIIFWCWWAHVTKWKESVWIPM